MSATVMDQIRHLSVDERIRLVQEIWESIAAENQAPVLSPVQRAEIRRRIAPHRNVPARPVDRHSRERCVSGNPVAQGLSEIPG